MRRIAIASCRSLPTYERDDAPLYALFRERGVALEVHPWDEEQVDWARFDAVLLRTTWDYSERVVPFLAWIERVSQLTRLFNPAAVVRWNADKHYLRDLHRAGIPTVPTTFAAAHQPFDLRAWAASLDEESRGFFKPTIAVNSMGTLRFSLDDEQELAHAQTQLDQALSRGAMMLQPYRRGVEEYGELSVIWFAAGARHEAGVSHGVRKRPVTGDYRVQEGWGGVDEPLEVSEALAQLTSRALEVAREVTGERLLYARADYLMSAHGPELIELELIEPSLFFRHGGERAVSHLVDALCAALWP